MNEFSIIQHYFARAAVSPDVVLGIGDDCAIVSPPEGRKLVMSIDTVVEGVHFPKDSPPDKIAVRALAAAMSDLAAMGARPHWFTLALTIPEADERWLALFSDGLFSLADRYEISLIGGDTTRGPLAVTIQVHGSVEPGTALRRAGAKPEDIVYVTGTLGDGAAALSVIQKKMTVSTSAYDYLLKRFYAPEPKIREGEMLVGMASSCIDLSDGLHADLTKICEASGVGAFIDLNRVPTSDLWSKNTSEGKRIDWAISGGDDYQLCFTVPRVNVSIMETWIKEERINAVAIGKIVHHTGVVLVKDGKPYLVDETGYDHFV